MSLNLLAIGDVHFDAPSLLGEDEREILELSKKDAFKRAVDEAVARNVSAFLICGDLYNSDSVSFETLIFLRKCFLQLASCGIKILYAHGKTDSGPVPQLINTNNLIDFSLEVERYELVSPEAVQEAVICSSGYAENAGVLITQFEEKNSSYPTIGLMYVNEGFSKQGAVIMDGLANLGYDLFILGGYHHYLAVRGEDNIIYVGSPTGTWFGDKAGGALYAELNNYGQLVLDKIPLSDVTWQEVEIQNISETDIGSLKRRIEIDVQSAVENTKDSFVKVILSGRCFLADELTDEAIEAIREELSGTLGLNIFIEKQNLLPMLPKSLFDSTSPFVESVKIIDSIKNDDDKLDEVIGRVEKRYGLFVSELNEKQKEKYIKLLKDGLLDTLCKVMIKEAGYEN